MHFRLALILAALLALSGCMHVRVSSKDLLRPDEPPAAAHLAAGYVVEDALMQRPGRVVGITRAHRPGNRVVIIFCGGDAFHRSIEGGPVLTALARDADVVLFDYPGFGTSTGAPNPDSILDNARAAAEYVARLATTAGQKQVVYGFSLGGVVAAQLAGERSFDGVVLEATSADVGSWARSQVPWFAKPLVRIELDPALARIDNARALAGFRGSILILAGEQDKRAPPALSRKLAQRLKHMGVRTELQEIARAGHGDIYKSPLYEPVIDRFLASLRGAP
jgi:pimeloyl-ACP methyl ester carboxylesterase